ncbi:MAG: peptidase M48 Ste24p [Methylobacter sp.]|nr:MAG: peptidase M48 Ste24p [Methylobacter sp.]PPD05268.1 MAG: peptidase M48 Ste24p [Methylobacter sp.]PPD22463.1 MAG: peptidase M48 Ste24p [Methylobacter sp.]
MLFNRSLISSALIFALSTSNISADIDKIQLPDIGDSSGTLISPAQEIELGEAFFRSLHSQLAINQDPEIQHYIQTIGKNLVINSDNPGYPFHFFVVLENDINAFAGPGGYIGVNSGLILTTEAESELASVMAHEIAHVTQRHLYRAFEAASRLSIPTAVATLAAILIGTQSPGLGQAAIVAAQAGSAQFQINFTRENEEEADRVGMQTLAGSQYDPRSMPTFFERLQQATRYVGQNVPEFLRTHPVTSSRISDSRGRAETYPYKQFPDSMAYQLAKAKLRILTTEDPKQALAYFQNRLTLGTEEQRAISRYGFGLALLNMQKLEEAETIFLELVKNYPDQPQFLTAMARTAQESKNFPKALSLYEKASKQFPDNEGIKFEFIRSLLKTGNPELAKKNLQSLNAKVQKSPLFYELIAEAYSEMKQPAESHRYLAEYYYVSGQSREAITQIRLAQKEKNLSFQLASILNERLKFFISEFEAAHRER